MEEIRCCSCGSLLARASIKDGRLETKCKKCGTVNTLEIKPDPRSYEDRLKQRLQTKEGQR